MKFKLVIVLILLIQSFAFASEDPERLFSKANEHYKTGEYDSAKALYMDVLSIGMHSKELYYNLGNTHYKLGNIPAAILYFEKSKRLDPSDMDTRYNLDVANAGIIDKIQPVGLFFLSAWWATLASSFSADRWGLFFILLMTLVLAGIGLFLNSLNSGFRQVLFFVIIINATLSLFSLGLAAKAYEIESKTHGIVFSPSVNVKSEPAANGSVQFVVHEGLKVEMHQREGDWVLVHLPDGKAGWVPANSIEAI